jgi:hypothetical protein
MATIVVKMQDGTVKTFPHEERRDRFATTNVKYEVGFVVVTDVWGKTISIPADQIEEVITERR